MKVYKFFWRPLYCRYLLDSNYYCYTYIQILLRITYIFDKTCFWILGRKTVAYLFWLSFLTVLSCSGSHPSWLSCPGFLILVLCRHGCPFLGILYHLSCSGCPVLVVLFWLSFSCRCLVLVVLFWRSCPCWLLLNILFWLSCSSCPILHQGTSCKKYTPNSTEFILKNSVEIRGMKHVAEGQKPVPWTSYSTDLCSRESTAFCIFTTQWNPERSWWKYILNFVSFIAFSLSPSSAAR